MASVDNLQDAAPKASLTFLVFIPAHRSLVPPPVLFSPCLGPPSLWEAFPKELQLLGPRLLHPPFPSQSFRSKFRCTYGSGEEPPERPRPPRTHFLSVCGLLRSLCSGVRRFSSELRSYLERDAQSSGLWPMRKVDLGLKGGGEDPAWTLGEGWKKGNGRWENSTGSP